VPCGYFVLDLSELEDGFLDLDPDGFLDFGKDIFLTLSYSE
jgi:hypothetical protein